MNSRESLFRGGLNPACILSRFFCCGVVVKLRAAAVLCVMLAALVALLDNPVSVIQAASPPVELQLQGRLTDSDGNPVTGDVDVRVYLYNDPTAGAVQYEERFNPLAIVNGQYSIPLGAGIGVVMAGNLQTALRNNAALYMTLKVAPDIAEMTPRVAVRAAPFAVNALTVEGSRYQKASGADPAGAEGDLLYRTDTDVIKVYNGSAWVPFDVNLWDRPSAGVLTPKTAGDVVRAGNGAAATPAFSFAADPNTGVYGDGADALLFSTAGTERVRIDAAGRVGIGTNNPGRPLYVTGTLANGTHTASFVNAGNGYGVAIGGMRDSGGVDGAFGSIQAFDTVGGMRDLVLQSVAGNVGIGITTPLAKLHAYTGTGGDIAIFRDAANFADLTIKALPGIDTVLLKGGPNDSLNFSVGASDTPSMTISLAGNVGIGTNPSYPLHISKDGGAADPYATLYVNSPTNHGGIVINAPATQQSHLRFSQAGALKWQLRTGIDANLKIYNWAAATDVATFQDTTGNMGIRNTAPETRLHIDYDAPNTTLTGNATYGGIHLDQSATNDEYTGITTSATSTGTQGGILFQGSGAYGTKIHFMTTDSYAAGMKNRMTLDHVGNLGIGTTSPGFALDVANRTRLRQGSSGSAGTWLYQTTPAADRAFMGMMNDDNVGMWGNAGAGWGLIMNVTSGYVDMPKDSATLRVPRKSTAGDPAAGVSADGMIYYNTATSQFRVRRNGTWSNLASGGAGTGGLGGQWTCTWSSSFSINNGKHPIALYDTGYNIPLDKEVLIFLLSHSGWGFTNNGPANVSVLDKIVNGTESPVLRDALFVGTGLGGTVTTYGRICGMQFAGLTGRYSIVSNAHMDVQVDENGRVWANKLSTMDGVTLWVLER